MIVAFKNVPVDEINRKDAPKPDPNLLVSIGDLPSEARPPTVRSQKVRATAFGRRATSATASVPRNRKSETEGNPAKKLWVTV